MNPELLTIHKHPRKKLKGKVLLPGSKSESNRALLFAALSPYPMLLEHLSDCDDSRVFLDFLRTCGLRMEPQDGGLNVVGSLREVKAEERTIELGLAGTALRFITAAATLVPGTTLLDGKDRLRKRVVAPLVEALQDAGADIAYLGEPGYLPLRIKGKPGWQPTAFRIDATESSQLLSALLLLGPVLPVGCTIHCTSLASKSYAQMTLDLLADWGVHWQQQDMQYTLAGRQRNPPAHAIESDWSAASYWLGLAATKPADLRLRTLHPHSKQGDRHQLEIFRGWGMDCRFEGSELHVRTDGILVRGLDYDFGQMPDLAQTFAVLATWADETSELTGLHTLPGKETDRLAALVAELGKLGVHAVATSDKLLVYPSLQMQVKQPVATYEDHRFAMSFALLANRFSHISIEDPQVVGKSYPAFWSHLEQLGYPIEWA
ncbi:MAG: 3-phosphoshikimate 1-carboxyvinyltransferase [Bacteroidetes bacterium]|jgi:3-phosphoshikimate 1-carboxyvinyltransferase|nr:3-phosphoshikimate 1-carboxyvinyltransferase [Bacteroidota bacterium]